MHGLDPHVDTQNLTQGLGYVLSSRKGRGNLPKTKKKGRGRGTSIIHLVNVGLYFD